MRCIPRLIAFASLALLCAAPAYATQHLFETVTVSGGVPTGPGMDGPSESPANASPGTGYGTALYDDLAHTLKLDATFTGLTGTVTQSHIHTPTATPFVSTVGVVVIPGTLPGFPPGVTSGIYSQTLDLTQASSYAPTYVSLHGGVGGAEIALISQFNQGRAYWNIHSSTFGGGEIRGFFVSVPEPATCALIAMYAAFFGCFTRTRRK